jgi:hypothetical protein
MSDLAWERYGDASFRVARSERYTPNREFIAVVQLRHGTTAQNIAVSLAFYPEQTREYVETMYANVHADTIEYDVPPGVYDPLAVVRSALKGV